jgi:TRAP-type mannitol/chloroaromatic compound transport system permease small subunit
MPSVVVKYVRVVDYLSTRFGRIAMYLIFLMIGTLLLDAVTRNMLNIPLFWCVELAQFTLAAYYIMGGPYSMQLETHVRMDLLYDRLSERNKARMDSFTAIFLVVYLIVLLIGCISSTIYSIETNQRLFSMWNPSVVPIKLIMLFGIFLMLLQTLSTFFKDLAKARGLELA